ncbi:putative bifunctional diguanylate cyclase/phosphodiesterase [Sandaracinobacteroides hominis]|uniref:putative bifunctional diguanylate cyclase/phosphodiesterase n=1 Tax=Sandaracinobacteroides hominis TaxID=2780086 RepID=UPI0018F4DD16|nr:EAL domain-containing protein [Sandaracinobacteroides hominis]
MTAVFLPPKAASIRWRDLIRMGMADDPYWQRVRQRQLRFVERYLPVNLLMALFTLGVLGFSFEGRIDPLVLGFWLLAQAMNLLATLQVWNRDRLGRPRRLSGLRPMRVALAHHILTGAAWGLLFHQMLATAQPGDAMLLGAVAISCIGCHAYTSAPWPLGSIGSTSLMALGALTGLVAGGWDNRLALALVIVGYMVFVTRGNLLITRALMQRMRLKERIQEQGEVVRLLLNEFEANGSEWLYEFDSTGRLTFASTRFAEALRRPVEEVVGHHWTRFLHERAAGSELSEFVRRGLPFRDFLLRVEVEGEVRWWLLSGTPKVDSEGRPLGYRGVGSDVTDRQRAAERIAELATFDALTGLVNRRVIHQALAEGLQPGCGTALLFIDLDRFKAVNDSLGHGSGDRLLAEVSQRLRRIAAEHGGDGALVGRLGGDEFAIVLPGTSLARALSVGEAIIAGITRPFSLGDKSAHIGASIGVALGPSDGATVETLMRAADLALYDAKARGRGNVRHYDRDMHQQAEARRSLEMDLRNAMAAGQLRLAFQPVVDAMDERIVGFEALARWRHPTLGDIPPSVFIPLAEEAGLIRRIGAWVLNEACKVAAGWPRHIQLAVNLSPLQFDDPGLVETVHRTLRRWNIAPERLELELTESLFLDERPQTSAMLAELEEMGVGFALDDFGTGYSSLGYLQKIAFRRIKIDRSFVRKSATDGGEATAIIQAIVALAERLGMETTAEGTETRAEFEAMRRLGCAQVQGYYFGRPMPAEEAARLIDRSRPLLELVDEPPPVAILRNRPMLPAASAQSPTVAAPSTHLPPAELRGLPPG